MLIHPAVYDCLKVNKCTKPKLSREILKETWLPQLIQMGWTAGVVCSNLDCLKNEYMSPQWGGILFLSQCKDIVIAAFGEVIMSSKSCRLLSKKLKVKLSSCRIPFVFQVEINVHSCKVICKSPRPTNLGCGWRWMIVTAIIVQLTETEANRQIIF